MEIISSSFPVAGYLLFVVASWKEITQREQELWTLSRLWERSFGFSFSFPSRATEGEGIRASNGNHPILSVTQRTKANLSLRDLMRRCRILVP